MRRIWTGRRLSSQSALMIDSPIQPPPGPPPVVCSDRVVEYAVLDDSVGFNSGHGLFFVDGKEIGRVPCLAICQARTAPEFVLFFCDSDWSMLGVATYDSVANAKKRAERIYPGSSARWVEAHFTEEEAIRYLNEIWADQICSFCGKRPDETLTTTFQGNGSVRICGKCVARMYTDLTEPHKRD